MSARGPLAAFLAFGVLWGAWAALVPAVQSAVDASAGELGLALLFVPLGSLPAMVLAGRAIDRRGGKLLPLAFAALAVVALGPGLAGSVAALAAAMLLVGAASGAADVAVNAAVTGIEAETGARLMQLAHGLFSLGVVTGALGTGLARQAGAERLEILLAVAALLAVTAWANRLAPGAAPGSTASRPRLRGRFVVLGLACAAAFLVEGAIESWSALFLERELGAAAAVGALAPAGYAAAMAAGRFGAHGLERRVGQRALLAGGGLLACAALVAVSAAPNAPVALVAFALGGAGVSVAAPVLFGAAGRAAPPHERGTAVASVTTLGYLGFAAGPPLVGGIAEAAGLRAAFVALAAAAALLAAAATRLRL